MEKVIKRSSKNFPKDKCKSYKLWKEKHGKN